MIPADPAASPGGQRFSALLAVACLGLAAVLPVLTLQGLWTMSPETWLGKLAIRPADGATWPARIAPWQNALAVLLGMLPVTAMAYALWRARQCLQRFAHGEVFSLAVVRHLRALAAGMFCSAVAALAVQPLIGIVLTWHAPSGQRAIALGAGSQELLVLVFAAIVWQIAHVMTQAVELADQHAQIV